MSFEFRHGAGTASGQIDVDYPVIELPICEILPIGPRARLVRLRVQTFQYRPGQAVLVGNASGWNCRPYSIASAPEDVASNGWIELLVGVDASGLAGPHLALEIGSLVRVEGPCGSFKCPCHTKAATLVFVGGGIGIAPFRAMLRHAVQAHVSELVLLYSARSPEELAFREEFESLESSGRLRLYQTVTRAGADDWSGARGRLRSRDLLRFAGDPTATWFVCGPGPFVVSVVEMLGDIGVTAENVQHERWIRPQFGASGYAL